MEPRSNLRAPTISLGVRVAAFTTLSVLTAILLSALVLEISGRAEARGAADEQLGRARSLAVGRLARDGEGLRRLAATVSRDPKFFALLALRRSERTATFRQSLEGVIREFQADANVEIFDVTDEWGATAAASQRPAAPEPSQGASPLVRQALAGKGALGFRLEGGRLYRIAVVPVMAGGAAAVGTLTLGSRVDETFAGAIRSATGVDVLLLAGEISASGDTRAAARPIVTTLSDAGARSVLETIGAARLVEARGKAPRGRMVSIAKAPAVAIDVPLGGGTEGGAARLLLVAPVALDAGLAPLRGTLLLAGAVAATMVLFAGFFAGRKLSTRLRRIRAAARDASQGEWETTLPAVASDEVGLLTSEFHAMRESQRRELARLNESDGMKSDFLAVTAQDLLMPVEEIQKAGTAMAANNARALGPDGLRHLRVIRGGAETLSRMVHDLGGARVVSTHLTVVEPVWEETEDDDEVEATLEVVASEANFQPALPTPEVKAVDEVPPPPTAPMDVAAVEAPVESAAIAAPAAAGPLDVAALVESVAVDLIVAAAERGIEVDMAIEPDLIHPSASANGLQTSLREYGASTIATLSPGSVLSFAALRTPVGIVVRALGGATPFEVTLPVPSPSNGAPDLPEAS